MQACTVCAAPVRPGARFCTACGAPVSAVMPSSPPVEPLAVTDIAVTDAQPEPVESVPSRIPSPGRVTAPPARSESATWSFVAGLAPLVISIAGNLIAIQLGAAALERVAAGETQGAWAGVLVTLALVFVLNAGLLTVCAIAGVRGIRETGNGVTRGRGLAIAGLAAGTVNLVLWVAGLVVSVNGLDAALS
ncbi:MAG: hypothetical protein RLZZ608_761 [Actinomycetota bacterium]|jgi:zinc-ribbon domain